MGGYHTNIFQILGETNGLGLLICKKEPFACISLKFVRCPDGSTVHPKPSRFQSLSPVWVTICDPWMTFHCVEGAWPATRAMGFPSASEMPWARRNRTGGASSFFLRMSEYLGAAKFCSVWINNAPTFGVSSVSLHLFIDQKSWLCKSLILLVNNFEVFGQRFWQLYTRI